MKYEIKGKFDVGGEWAEDAKNLKELAFVLEKISKNRTVVSSSVKVYKGDEDVTEWAYKKVFGSEEE